MALLLNLPSWQRQCAPVQCDVQPTLVGVWLCVRAPVAQASSVLRRYAQESGQRVHGSGFVDAWAFAPELSIAEDAAHWKRLAARDKGDGYRIVAAQPEETVRL